MTKRIQIQLLQSFPKKLRKHISVFSFRMLQDQGSAVATAVVFATAIIVVDQEDQDDDKQQPRAVAVAEQVFQTHMRSPPFVVTFHTMRRRAKGAKKRRQKFFCRRFVLFLEGGYQLL